MEGCYTPNRENSAVCRAIEILRRAIRYQRFMPYMHSSAYNGVGWLSFGAVALDFVSSVGIQAYDKKRKGQRILFIFHFQVDGSVVLQGTKVSDDSNFYPVF